MLGWMKIKIFEITVRCAKGIERRNSLVNCRKFVGVDQTQGRLVFWIVGTSRGSFHTAHHFVWVWDHFQNFAAYRIIHHICSCQAFFVNRGYYISHRTESLNVRNHFDIVNIEIYYQKIIESRILFFEYFPLWI